MRVLNKKLSFYFLVAGARFGMSIGLRETCLFFASYEGNLSGILERQLHGAGGSA